MSEFLVAGDFVEVANWYRTRRHWALRANLHPSSYLREGMYGNSLCGRVDDAQALTDSYGLKYGATRVVLANLPPCKLVAVSV